jgi:hypothetical protein
VDLHPHVSLCSATTRGKAPRSTSLSTGCPRMLTWWINSRHPASSGTISSARAQVSAFAASACAYAHLVTRFDAASSATTPRRANSCASCAQIEENGGTLFRLRWFPARVSVQGMPKPLIPPETTTADYRPCFRRDEHSVGTADSTCIGTIWYAGSSAHIRQHSSPPAPAPPCARLRQSDQTVCFGDNLWTVAQWPGLEY